MSDLGFCFIVSLCILPLPATRAPSEPSGRSSVLSYFLRKIWLSFPVHTLLSRPTMLCNGRDRPRVAEPSGHKVWVGGPGFCKVAGPVPVSWCNYTPWSGVRTCYKRRQDKTPRHRIKSAMRVSGSCCRTSPIVDFLISQPRVIDHTTKVCETVRDFTVFTADTHRLGCFPQSLDLGLEPRDLWTPGFRLSF